MTNDLNETIEHDEQGQRGAFFIARDSVRVAEMTYWRSGPEVVTIDHTLVAPELRQQGIGGRLIDAAIAWARATDTKLRATCPFVVARFANDESLRDVLK